MKVILLQDVDGLGKVNDVVQVKDGYARNYLFRKGLALQATSSNMNVINTRRTAALAKQDKELEEAQQIASEINGQTFAVPIKSGTGGRLYGALTSMDVASALERIGHKVDRRGIHLPEPVRQLGEYDVDIRLHAQVTARIRIRVESAEG